MRPPGPVSGDCCTVHHQRETLFSAHHSRESGLGLIDPIERQRSRGWLLLVYISWRLFGAIVTFYASLMVLSCFFTWYSTILVERSSTQEVYVAQHDPGDGLNLRDYLPFTATRRLYFFVLELTVQIGGDPALPRLVEQPFERPPQAHLGRGEGVRARIHPTRCASTAARVVHPPVQGAAGPDQHLRPAAPQERFRLAHPCPAEASRGGYYEGACMSYHTSNTAVVACPSKATAVLL